MNYRSLCWCDEVIKEVVMVFIGENDDVKFMPVLEISKISLLFFFCWSKPYWTLRNFVIF